MYGKPLKVVVSNERDRHYLLQCLGFDEGTRSGISGLEYLDKMLKSILSDELFRLVIKSTPLVATDLVVVGEESNKILLGLRTNAPAKNFWFVPGRRIHKNEFIEESLNYIVANELGVDKKLDFSFFGVETHFYEENYYQDFSFNTHYIILSYLARISESAVLFPDSQHIDFKFWEFEEALKSSLVHDYTKVYIRKLINLRDNDSKVKLI